MLLFRALANNMAPMTNADESPDESPYAFLTEHFSLYGIYSLTSGNGKPFASSRIKAVFQLRVFHTYVDARKSLNPFQYYI